jgi:hypothetical protein
MGVYRFSTSSSLVKSGQISYLPPLQIEYLVVAGGGGGASGAGQGFYGGGGAGGFRTNVAGQMSGGGSSAEPPLILQLNTNYAVTIGAGGVGGISPANTVGGNSTFSNIVSIGGGTSAFQFQSGTNVSLPRWREVGGSSAGISFGTALAPGTPNQGYRGGLWQSGTDNAGGGGGAGQDGGVVRVNGGNGQQSNITGTSTFYAGGGGGGGSYSSGGSGGGGGGTPNVGGFVPGGPGVVNTGGGGGGAFTSNGGGAGGSGVIILRYPSFWNITVGAGLTGTTATVGASKVTTITAGTGNVSWAA